ncbi:intraflagellar transport protein 27 homolog [Palaemon carinicauda]|uniref:intraflagellar transport protein 27 homolog n=1 Tax=Palaemon carinicauda TaxID=392227 RepID=UPI0035B5F496
MDWICAFGPESPAILGPEEAMQSPRKKGGKPSRGWTARWKNESETETLGVDIATKLINVPDTNYSVELFLFDCSGKEFYRNLVMKMSSQPSLVLLVYDVTSEQSFKCITDLYNWIKGQHSEQLNGVLFANKCDLTSRRIVSPKSGRDIAHSLGLQYFEGSAKDQVGIEEPFFFLVNEWFKTYTDRVQAMKLVT